MNVAVSIEAIWFSCNHNVRREVKPLNVVGSMKVILLVAKFKFKSVVNPVNVAGRNSFIGLSKLSKVCLYDNPISLLMPLQLDSLCSMNFNCFVYILSKC